MQSQIAVCCRRSNILAMLPDTAERYLSAPLFDGLSICVYVWFVVEVETWITVITQQIVGVRERGR